MYYFVFLMILFCKFDLAWSSPIDLSTVTEGQKIGKNLYIFEDTEWELDFSDIKDKSLGDFNLSTVDTPNFGFKPYPFWARFDLDNPSDQTKEFYLKYGYAVADNLTLYYPDAKGIYKHLTLGDRNPYANQEVHSREPIFRLKVEPGKHSYYLKLETLGSNVFPLTISDLNGFEKSLVNETIVLALLLGVIIAMTGYNFFLYVSFRTKVYLYYVFYMASFTLYSLGLLGLSRMFIGTEHAYNWLSNEGFLVSTEIYNIFMILFTVEFLNLKERMPRFAKFFSYYRIFQVINIFICQFHYELGAKTAVLSVIFTMACMSYAGIKSALKGYRPAYFYSLAFSLVLIGNLIVALKFRGILPFNVLTNWVQLVGGAMEALLLSLALGDRVNYYRNRSEQKIKSLNSELTNHIQNVELIVEMKTRDIKSMMANIKQGIFTIRPSQNCDDGGLIDADYSVWLESFLGRKSFADTSLMSTIFSDVNLSSDDLSRMVSILFSCLGEDEIAYEANATGLPRSCEMNSAKGTLAVEIDWSPILNEDSGLVEKILVTIRDVTEVKQLKEQSEKQNLELKYLSEITRIDESKFSKFMDIAHQFIEENVKYIKNSKELSNTALDSIFINLHTLKGISRTYNFSNISEAIHEEENLYSKLRSLPSNRHFNQELALAGQQKIKDLLYTFENISQRLLGRDKNESILKIDKEFVRLKLEELTELNMKQFSVKNQELISSLKQQFASFFFHSLDFILDDLKVVAKTLAKDLAKEKPEIETSGEDILFTQPGCDLLKQVFIHLIRNSMDHGIEKGDIRTSLGKKPEGRIFIKTAVNDEGLKIEYSDDGRGLDLKKLVEKAKIAGIIDNSAQLDTKQKARLILESGVSTMDGISEISGRGVGMKAVNEFIIQAGGQFDIVVDSQSDDFVPVHFEIFLPYDYFRLSDRNVAA